MTEIESIIEQELEHLFPRRELVPDWGEVERRFRRPRRRRLVALVLVTVLVLLLAGLSAIFRVTGSSGSSGLDRFSNQGTLVARPGVPGRLYLLGVRADTAFYRLEGRKLCVGIGWASEIGHPGAGGCGAHFPSASEPVMTFAGVVATKDHDGRVFQFAGLAADGVAKLELLSPRGAILAAAPIRDNIFTLPSANGLLLRGDRVVFLDRQGKTVHVEQY
ncbi:MAG TPA: hypothetical protein VF002_06610 [Gaiellaceae bacterium]